EALSLRGDREVPRPTSAGEAPGPLAGPCSRRRLPPRPDRLERRTAENPTRLVRRGGVFSCCAVHRPCGYPSTGGCQRSVENGSYAGSTSRGTRQQASRGKENAESGTQQLLVRD